MKQEKKRERIRRKPMPGRRKAAFLAVMTICIMVFATSAYADMAARTAYEQLKESIRETVRYMDGEALSYTISSEITVQDNGSLVAVMTNTQKKDNPGKRNETTHLVTNPVDIVEMSYNYSDPEQSIWYDRTRDAYYLTKYAPVDAEKESLYSEQSPVEAEDKDSASNFFGSQQYRDVERIIDALVGNLKDNVNQTERRSDGSREIYGSLTEMQIPPLVNALVSFVFKQAQPGNRYDSRPAELSSYRGEPVPAKEILGGDMADPDKAPAEGDKTNTPEIRIPVMVDDLYIQHVTGRTTLDADGRIRHLTASGTIHGTDADGKAHELVVTVKMDIRDLNTTVLAAPDLTGKKVVENASYPEKALYTVTDRYVGTYTSDIIAIRDNQFVRIGIRTIRIAHIENTRVAGSYSQEYFDPAGGKDFDFTFDAPLPPSSTAISFQYTDMTGMLVDAGISFDMNEPELYFHANDLNLLAEDVSNPVYDKQYASFRFVMDLDAQ